MEFLPYLNAARRQAEKRRRIEQENTFNNRRVTLQPYSSNQLDRIPAAEAPSVSQKRAPEIGRIGTEEIKAELAIRDRANKRARNSRVRAVTPPLAFPLKRNHASPESKSIPVQRENFAANQWPSPTAIQSEVSGNFAANQWPSPTAIQSGVSAKPRPAVLLRMIRSPVYSFEVNAPARNHRATASAIGEGYYRRPPQNDQRQGREFFSGRCCCPNVTEESASASPPKAAAPTAPTGVRESSRASPRRSKYRHSFPTVDRSKSSAFPEEYQSSILAGKNAEDDKIQSDLLYGINPEDDQIKSLLVNKVVDLLVECSPGINSNGVLIRNLAAHAVNENIRAGITPTSLMYILLKIKGRPAARFETFVELATSANNARKQLSAAKEREKVYRELAALSKELSADKEREKDASKQEASPSFIKQIPIVAMEPQEPISEKPTDQGQIAENSIDQKPEKSSQDLSDLKLQAASISEKPEGNRQTLEDHENLFKLENKISDEQTPLEETADVSDEINVLEEETAEVSDEMNILDEQVPLDEIAEVSDEIILSDEKTPLDEIAEVPNEQVPLDDVAEVPNEIEFSDNQTPLDDVAEVPNEIEFSDNQTPLDDVAEDSNEDP